MWALEGSNTWMPPASQMSNTCKSNAQQESLLGQFLVIPQLFEWIRCVARFWMTCMQLFLSEYGSVLAKSLRNPSYLQNHSKFKGAPDKPTSPSLNSSASSSLRLSRNRVHRLTEMPWTIWTHDLNALSKSAEHVQTMSSCIPILCCQMSRLCDAVRAVDQKGESWQRLQILRGVYPNKGKLRGRISTLKWRGKRRWLNFDRGTKTLNTMAVLHGGVRYACTI